MCHLQIYASYCYSGKVQLWWMERKRGNISYSQQLWTTVQGIYTQHTPLISLFHSCKPYFLRTWHLSYFPPYTHLSSSLCWHCASSAPCSFCQGFCTYLGSITDDPFWKNRGKPGLYHCCSHRPATGTSIICLPCHICCLCILITKGTKRSIPLSHFHSWLGAGF